MQSVVQPALVRAQEFLGDAGRQEMYRHAEASRLQDLALDDQKTIGFTFKCLGAGIWALKQDGSRPRGPGGLLFRNVLNLVSRAVRKCDESAALYYSSSEAA